MIQENIEVVTVPLATYSSEGKLFPTGSLSQDFVVESWRLWSQVPLYGSTPRVYRFDFSGIREVDPGSLTGALGIVLSGQWRGGRPVRAVFDNLAEGMLWTGLNGAVFDYRAVVVARKQGGEWELAGDYLRISGCREMYDELQGRDWVNGGGTVLRQMYNEGLLFRRGHPPHNYQYRTLT
ncbi:hypothetical protein HYU96_03125 [Candidatus Daviesbacteria bacterium]|nr:hypothetical protein [Candidatus Daviesbacteria bacterium]